MVRNNLTTFRNGLKRAKEVIYGVLDDKFIDLTKRLFEIMCNSKDYTGFTGNTQRSYTAALFLDGTLYYMVQGKDKWTANEIRKKVQYKEYCFLQSPYEGSARGVKGAVPVDDYYGWETAMRLAMNNHKLSDGWEIVCSVGTEYFFYIEGGTIPQMIEDAVGSLNLMTKMFKSANSVIQLKL